MFGNYALSALRAIQRDPWHAAINVLGLAVALAASLLIALYVRRELTYEDFFTQPERVYRVDAESTLPGKEPKRGAVTPYPLTELLSNDFGADLVPTRLFFRQGIVSIEGAYTRQTIAVVDEHFFDVLDFPVAQGDAAAALTEPDAIIVTERMARRLFGAEPAMGQVVRVDGEHDLHVAAILRDLPRNTDFDFDLLASIATPWLDRPDRATNWINPLQRTYVRLRDGVRAETIARQLPPFVERHNPTPDMTRYAFFLQPLRLAHLTGGANAGDPSNMVTLAGLSATGMFLVFIACFNYINLAAARSMLRVREVGLRKIFGGRAGHIALRLFAEAAATTAIAFALALIAAAAALPVFANLVDRDLALSDLAEPGYAASALALFAVVSLAAGAVPALALAARSPAELFRERKAAASGGLLRTGIVTAQFALTSALMIVAAVVFAQLSYLRSFDLGFDARGLLLVPMPAELRENGGHSAFRDALAASPAVASVTMSDVSPGASRYYRPLFRPGWAGEAVQAPMMVLVGDEGFFDLYGLAPLAGRTFSEEIGADLHRAPSEEEPLVRASIVLSRSALPLFGFASPDQAIGAELSNTTSRYGRTDYTVIGVVPDFHFLLSHRLSEPMVYFLDPNAGNQITARVREGAELAAVEDARRIWTEMFPAPFEHLFLEDRIAAANADDDRQSRLFALFTGFALFVSCLGLVALASFAAAQRAREIAVRKVLGASTARVSRLLLWDFAKPVLLANVIAWPLALLLVRPWLDRFPYRIELSPAFFLGVSAVTLAAALATVMARTLGSARAHPAFVLRNN